MWADVRHHNENYFGCVKRLAHEDESVESFLRASERALLLRILCRTIKGMAVPDQCGRVSMSGARLPFEEAGNSHPIGLHWCRTLSLWNLISRFGTNRYTKHIESEIMSFSSSIGFIHWDSPEDAFTMLPQIDEGKPCTPKTITDRNSRVVSVDGMKCQPRWASDQQMRHTSWT